MLSNTNNDLEMPKIIINIIDCLKMRHPNISEEIITSITIAKIMQMFSAKRIEVSNVEQKELVNWFSLIFIPQEAGIENLITDIDQLVLNKFFEWYQNTSKKLLVDNKNENYKIIDLIPEIKNTVPKVITLLGQIIKDIDFGNILIKISEFGDYISGSDRNKKELLTLLKQLYSCSIQSENNKSEIVSKPINGIPINLIAYSDYTYFKDYLKSYYDKILNTNFAHNFVINFHKIKQITNKFLTDDENESIINTLKNASEELYNIFCKIEMKSCYKLSSDERLKMYKYKNYTNHLYNSEEKEFLRRELYSRNIKVLKLAGLYASINHPNLLKVDINDIKQAIKTIEFLSKDLKNFVSSDSNKDDMYVKAYKYLKDHEALEFTKTELMTIFCSQFGFSREILRRKFIYTLEVISDIGFSDGYVILAYSNIFKNGSSYALVKEEYSVDRYVTDLCTITKAIAPDLSW